MVSDQEIAQGLESLFRETNPNSFTSLNEVILRLQSKLGFDLSHKIDFIRAHITLLFNAPPQQPPPPPPQQVVVPVSRSHPQSFNPNVNVVGQQHGVFHSPVPGSGQSYFPRGPTEISFAQPGSVVAESLSASNVRESTQSKPKRRGGPGGLNKLCGVSPQLQTIVGQPALPRTEIVKQLWAYIRKNNLQDPSNKRKIICNDELRLVFEVDCTDMFQMNKLLAKHIVPLDPAKVPDQPAKKAKVEESEVPSTNPATPAATAPAPATPAATAPAPATAPTPAPTTTPPPASTPVAPILISEALSKFLGTSEKELPQAEVYNRIEEYIKAKGLEDSLNSMVVCDTKLQELLGRESVPTHELRDAVACSHLFPRS